MNKTTEDVSADQELAPTPSRRTRKFRLLAASAAVAGAAIGCVLAGSTGANAATPNATAQTVYEAKIVNQHVVLGAQTAPTTLVTSPALPAGSYQVSAIVGGVIFPSDQIVCAAFLPGHNDGVFGTAGNPVAGGTAGIYATAAIDDTVTVTAGQRVALTCNSFNPGRGTYAGDAVLELRPATVVH